MAKMSKQTKKCATLKWIFGILHFLCFVGPLLFFIPYAFSVGEVVSKVALGLTASVAFILLLVSLLVGVKYKAGLHRSCVWLLISGIMFCLKSVSGFIWTMAITSILDELVFSKLNEHYSTALLANKEMDKRGL